MTEELLIEVKIPGSEEKIDKITANLAELNKEQAKLVETNKALEKSGETNSKQYADNARQIEINKQKISENTATRKGLIQTLIAEDNSVKALRVQNAELIKQRDLINTKTTDGQNRIMALNAQIDANSKEINKNSSALEKQKMNIGNYASALDRLVPGLGGMITGLQGATKAALAFIATPLGLILAAIGLSLGALISYFKGSEEGQDRLNKIMQIGSAIMERVMDVVEDVGEAIFNAFTNPKKAAIDLYEFVKDNLINRFTAFGVILDGIINLDFKKIANGVIQAGTGVENATDKVLNLSKSIKEAAELGIQQGTDLAKLQKEIRDAENKYAKDSANISIEVAKLREKSLSQEGDQKRKTIQEAIDLEKGLSNQAVSLANKRLQLAKLELGTNGETI